MDKIELINLISRTGMEYPEDDFPAKVDVIWQYFVDTDMFTEDEVSLVIHLNGYSEKTLNDMLFVRFGYRDLPQYLESELLNENIINENKNTKISKQQVVSLLKSAGLRPREYYIDNNNYIVMYTYKQYEAVEMLEQAFGENAVEFTKDDGVVAIKGFVKEAIHENKTLTENITEDNLTIVLNYVTNTNEEADIDVDTFLYDIDIWTGNEQLYPLTKPVYQTYGEMLNGDEGDIEYTLRQALQEAYPEYEIDYVELKGNLYSMTAIINYSDEDDNYIDIEVPVQIEEIEDTAWDDETRLGFWA